MQNPKVFKCNAIDNLYAAPLPANPSQPIEGLLSLALAHAPHLEYQPSQKGYRYDVDEEMPRQESEYEDDDEYYPERYALDSDDEDTIFPLELAGVGRRDKDLLT